jgi:hypothetical protein
MIYRILRRILRRHALFHLFIPLIVGVGVEIFYTRLFDEQAWSHLSAHLLSPPRIALYVGIFLAYLVVIGILIRQETEVGLRQLDLNVLADNLKNAVSLFAIGTMNFDEWFDPVVQVYLATIYERKLKVEQQEHNPFRYERILLLASRSAKRNLSSDYLDGYHAKCLIRIHTSLDINLYFLEWRDIVDILNRLTPEEKANLGYYPRWFQHLPSAAAKLLMFVVGRRRRVRKVAVGVVEMHDHTKSAFRFSKRDKVLSVRLEPSVAACARFVELIKEKILLAPTNDVKVAHDFTKFFDPA